MTFSSFFLFFKERDPNQQMQAVSVFYPEWNPSLEESIANAAWDHELHNLGHLQHWHTYSWLVCHYSASALSLYTGELALSPGSQSMGPRLRKIAKVKSSSRWPRWECVSTETKTVLEKVPHDFTLKFHSRETPGMSSAEPVWCCLESLGK